MGLSEEQMETLRGLDETGFHLNKGTPCECGPDDYTTTSSVGYSDFGRFSHSCGNCGNEFETYIEG